MERFINAVILALENKNWYGVLFIALSLPDICGSVDNPNTGSAERYTKWFKKYVEPKYTHCVGADEIKHVFLYADDCYALRCAYLHAGSGEITSQRIQQVLDSFVFVIPPATGSMHCNKFNTTLQLQVDRFCKDICLGAQEWQKDIKDNEEKIKRLADFLTIYSRFEGKR